MKALLAFAAGLLFAACSTTPPQPTPSPATPATEQAAPPAATQQAPSPQQLLLGGWGPSKDENFVYEFGEKTVLLESDMNEHPYVFEGESLVIDPGAETEIRYRVVSLTRDELVLEYPPTGTKVTFVRLTE